MISPDPAPFAVRPGRGRALLLSVPHSGRDYRPGLVDRARLGRASLERLEDPRVDELVAGALDRGFGAVIARAPRAVIDLNRSEEELDPRAVAGRSGAAPSARSAAGLGLLPTRLASLGELWRAPVDESELERRLAEVHRPYHAAIAAELGAIHARWGRALLVDCHSMPPRRAGEAQIVIGDRHGTSAAAWVGDAALRVAANLGFSVARNVPFAGGHIVERHGQPTAGVHAIQIEVDRACYCGRDARTPGPGFGRVMHLFEAIAEVLDGQVTADRAEAAE